MPNGPRDCALTRIVCQRELEFCYEGGTGICLKLVERNADMRVFGVGALCILGVFLLLDGRAAHLFPTFEQYAKTSTWTVVAAIPVHTCSDYH
jgi:hypothetical protein